MNEMYTRYAENYANVIDDNIYNAHYDKPSLLSLLGDSTFENCLDMGCGPGAYIDSLNGFCKNITGIDQSPQFIKIVSEKHPSVNAYVHDLNFPFTREKDESYDLVISALTIHYIKDLKKLFMEVNRVMKKNAVFAFSTHHPLIDFRDSISKNYFECEKLTQIWNTLKDHKTKVTFYRRSLTETFNSLFEAGFFIDGFSEGIAGEKIKEKSEAAFKKLSMKPQFLFIRAVKK